MKNINLHFIILIFALLISCKNEDENPVVVHKEVPNADFEDWGSVLEFEIPDGWGTSNFSLFGAVTFNTVTKEQDDVFSGSFCPRLETKGQIIDNSEVKVVGLITLGNFDVNIETKKAKVSGGIAFTGRPVALEGYYKYSGVGLDSCFVDIAITKYNKTLHFKDTIGKGRFSSASVPDWKKFNLSIDYNSSDDPDSLNIIILSSDTSIFEPGSTMWVDKLKLTY
ncbi:MAG: PCMD domain-containing protein [Bacteroidales bacterium]